MSWIEAFDFPKYEVSEDGKIRNHKGLVMKTRIDERGYESIRLYKGGTKYTKRISKLIWESFNDCKCKQTVDHIDRNKLNNHIENLRCVDASTNSKNRDNYQGKNVYSLSVELKKEIVRRYRNKEINLMDIQRQYGIPTNYTSVVFRRKTWDKKLDNEQTI